jgi:chloramphenicol-sensitive protein RarD
VRPIRDQPNGPRAGLFYGLTAYTIWGLIPLYFRAVSDVPPLVVLCQRVIWSALFMCLTVSIRGEWKAILPVLRSRRSVLLLTASAVLIATNWLVFIYAVTNRHVLQASLGYFITPLLSIALGMIFLRERLRGLQWLAVVFAALAVINLVMHSAGSAWISVSLAGSFGLYGLVRKKVDLNSLHGLLIESAILFPLAAIVLPLLPSHQISLGTRGLLSMSGIVTSVPLLCFGAAVRRLKLATIGFLQYVGPTLQFVVAVGIFSEPLDRGKLGSFALCWIAIAVYVADSLVNRRPQELADEPE